ncbi:MAG: hypothetical protein Q9183_005585 [Haloplaca sp. 2 TL-2023]
MSAASQSTEIMGERVQSLDRKRRVDAYLELVNSGHDTRTPVQSRCTDNRCPIKHHHFAGQVRKHPADKNKLPWAPWAIYSALDRMDYFKNAGQEAKDVCPREAELLRQFDAVHAERGFVAPKALKAGASKSKKPERKRQSKTKNGPKPTTSGSATKKETEKEEDEDAQQADKPAPSTEDT